MRTLIAVVTVATSLYDLAYVGLFTRPEPRWQTTQWLRQHSAPGSLIGFEQFFHEFRGDRTASWAGGEQRYAAADPCTHSSRGTAEGQTELVRDHPAEALASLASEALRHAQDIVVKINGGPHTLRLVRGSVDVKML